MKELKYISFLFGLTLCCMFMGYYLGYCDANSITVSQALAEGTMEKEKETAYNKTIAVVNMDEGTIKGEGSINYAAKLIDTVTDDIIITGLEDARRGIENGNYSAYIMIPAAFSENVETISTKPVKSQISYAVGSGLKGNERDEVIYRIKNIVQLFNSDLSKVYLSSILEEYHDAQDHASTIMENDTADMELLLAIEGEDLIEMIEIPEITEIENEIEVLDLAKNHAENEESVKNIDQSYREFYEEGKKELTKIQDSFGETDDKIDEIEHAFSETDKFVKDAADDQWDDTPKAAAEDTVYEELTAALVGELDENGDGTEGLLTAYNKKIQKYMEEHSAGSGEGGSGTDEGTNTQESGESNDPPQTNEPADQTELELLDIAAVKEQLDKLVEAAKKSRADRKTVIGQKEEQLSAISAKTQEIAADYGEMKASYEEKQEKLREFDMASYIDETKIDGYLSNMKENVSEVEEKTEEQAEAYEEYAEAVYETTREDIEAFEENIEQAQELSELRLTEGLAAAKESRTTNNEVNLLLLDTFANRLPYTRLGEVENKEVYEFIAAPVTEDNRSEAQPETKENRSPGIVLAVMIAGLLSVLSVVGIYALYRQRRKNKVTTVETQDVIDQSDTERRA